MQYFFLIVTLVIAYVPLAHGASFDCSKATTTVERMICADPEVSKLDVDLNVKYKAYLSKSANPDLIRQRQHYWLNTRNSCTNFGCLKIRYHKRIAELTIQKKELKDLGSKLEISKHSKDKNPVFCARLLDSLKDWKNVATLTPIVTTDSIDDSMLRKHFEKCNSRKFIRSVQIEPRIWNLNNLDSVSEEERENFGRVSIATKAFRLYRANIENDPSNREELILYGAGRRPESADDSDMSINLTYFNVIDTERCRISSSAQVEDIVNEENLSFVGLMRYENSTYVFDAKYYFMESVWGVGIQKWTYSPKSKRTFFSHICNYVAKD